MDVAFYLLLVSGTQRHGFESTSLFWGAVGLSPHLCFGGRGFESTTLVLWGCGFQSTISFFFFFWGGGGGGG